MDSILSWGSKIETEEFNSGICFSAEKPEHRRRRRSGD